MLNDILKQLKNIQTFIFDVDGVMSDGTLLLMKNGQLVRKMHIKDGYAIKLAIEKGFRIAAITGGSDKAVEKRLKALGVETIISGCQDKKEALEELAEVYGFSLKQTLYMGDDMPDYEAMKIVGFPCCPNNAVQDIKDICKFISTYNGGAGCVRDVIEKVLKVQGKWPNV